MQYTGDSGECYSGLQCARSEKQNSPGKQQKVAEGWQKFDYLTYHFKQRSSCFRTGYIHTPSTETSYSNSETEEYFTPERWISHFSVYRKWFLRKAKCVRFYMQCRKHKSVGYISLDHRISVTVHKSKRWNFLFNTQEHHTPKSHFYIFPQYLKASPNVIEYR